MKRIYSICLILISFLNCNFFAQSVTFNLTGGAQSYTVPAGCTGLCVNVSGAQGMGNVNNSMLGGLGGRVTGTLTVVAGQVLRIFVGGGNVASMTGGFNGGANGGSVTTNPAEVPATCLTSWGGGGGGASDIRISPYALANRVVVAGGGGGTGGNRMVGCSPGCGGGGGGGYFGGGGGGAYGGSPGAGGTQAAGGAGGASCCGCPLAPQAGAAGASGVGGVGGGLSGGNNQAANNPGCTGGAGGAAVGGIGPNCTGGTGCPSTWAGASGGGGSNYVGPLLGSTTTQGVQAGNGVVIVTPNNCPVLPIALLNFEVKYNKEKNNVDVNWSTASEKDNKYFVIERSLDAVEWEAISTVIGAGNSTKILHYNTQDQMPLENVSYYRIKQLDFNGHFTYSTALQVDIHSDFLIDIFPNPNNGRFALKYVASVQSPVNIKIFDVAGNLISTEVKNQIKEGANNFEVLTSELSSGMYFIEVSNQYQTSNIKFVKE